MKALVISVFIGLLLISSCNLFSSKNTDKAFERAEILMTDYPDSALEILNDISISNLSREEDKALFALLKSQALNKCFIDVTDDSLISIAVKFYEKGKCSNYRMLARYYAGRVYYYKKDYPNSLLWFVKAFEDARHINDDFWIAMTARGLEDVYTDTYNGIEAAKYGEICTKHMKLSGRQPHTNLALYDLAVAYYNIEKFVNAEKLIIQILDSAKKYNNPDLFIDAHRLRAKIALKSRKYKESVTRWEQVCRLKGSDYNDTVALLISQIKGNVVNVTKSTLSQRKFVTGLDAWLGYELCLALNDTASAFIYQQEIDKITNTEIQQYIQLGLNAITDEYYISRQEKAQLMLEKARLERAGIIIFFIVLIFGISFYSWHISCKHKDEHNRNIYIVENLKEVLKLKNNQNEKIRDLVHELLVENYKELDEKCKDYYSNSSEKSKRKISVEIIEIIEKFSNDKKTISELEDRINRYEDNLMADFRKDLEGLKEQDYRLFMFSVMGFSITAIMLFLKETKVEAVYSRKARLKVKIGSIMKEHQCRYLKYL